MAYFDSPKNNAMWEKEIKGLREKKERRKNGTEGIRKQADEASENAPRNDNPNRVPVSYQQLLKEEKQASAGDPRKNRARTQANEKQRNVPVNQKTEMAQGAAR